MNKAVELGALIQAEAVTTLGRSEATPDKIRSLGQELIRSMRRVLESGQQIIDGETVIDHEMLCDPEALEVIIAGIHEAVTNGHDNGHAEATNVLPPGYERAMITRFARAGIIARPERGGKTIFIPVAKTGCFQPGQYIVVKPTSKVDEFGHRIAVMEDFPAT